MKKFLYSSDYLPGTWKGLKLSEGGRSASFSCPNCGQLGSLTNHEIHKDGLVTPSVVCPTEGCTFHDYIQLEGWSPNANS